MTIYPTHSAFDDANENLIQIMKREPEVGRDLIRRGEILIVHAIVAPYGHDMTNAWLEREGKRVLFTGILEGKRVMLDVDLKEFYEHVKVKDTTKYTIFEARREELRTGHFGPWEARYRRLCPDLKERR